MISTLVVPTAIIASNSQSIWTKWTIEQIPSKETDYPGNNPNLIKSDVTSANKDSLGHYLIIGVVKNLGNSTLRDVMVTVHFFDDNNQTVGVTECCYTNPTDIGPGNRATFDSFINEDDTSGIPAFFRLSFEWISKQLND